MSHHAIPMPQRVCRVRSATFFILSTLLFLCLGLSQANGVAEPQVVGTILFQDAFQPSNRVRVIVKLQDVSVADASSITLSEHVIDRVDTIPIPFVMRYDPRQIKSSNAYAISVDVYVKRDDGQFHRVFRNMQSYPVITRGAGTELQVTVEPIR